MRFVSNLPEPKLSNTKSDQEVQISQGRFFLLSFFWEIFDWMRLSDGTRMICVRSFNLPRVERRHIGLLFEKFKKVGKSSAVVLKYWYRLVSPYSACWLRNLMDLPWSPLPRLSPAPIKLSYPANELLLTRHKGGVTASPRLFARSLPFFRCAAWTIKGAKQSRCRWTAVPISLITKCEYTWASIKRQNCTLFHEPKDWLG